VVMRKPDLGRPEPIWDDLPEEAKVALQAHVVVSTSLGYEIVLGWDDAAAVVGMSVRALKRAVARGRLPKYRTEDRGPRGCQVCWPLSTLWRYRQWRESPHQDAHGGAR